MNVEPLTGQSGNQSDIMVKEEYKEDDEDYGVMESSEGHNDLYNEAVKQSPERCPLYSTQEGLTTPHNHQAEDLMDIKIEVKSEEEESYMRDDQSHTEEAGVTRTMKEDNSTQISSDCSLEEASKDQDKMEDGYICSECGKCFSLISDLTTHQRTHTGEKPHSCPKCGKCFQQTSDHVKHLSSHTREKLYSCPECGKCFRKKSYLDIHQRSHTGEKPYFCSECGKFFARKSELAMHQKSHTGEKLFSCSDCGKLFLWKSQLVSHQRSHTGEKPYSCSECGKCFSQKSELVRHQRSQQGKCHTAVLTGGSVNPNSGYEV